MAKRIIITVTNDLVTDQRVNRIANTLLNNGNDILLVGRVLPYSTNLDTNCKVKRFKLWFNKGALFYANYNLRLFLYLLFNRFDIVLANDLDTLPAAFFASRIKRKRIVYDSHEYFTEVPELIGRSFQQNTWRKIEAYILPKLKYAYTVCQSIADKYNELYQTDFQVIRNVPLQKDAISVPSKSGKVIIYQGALNIGRGIELMIEAMQHLDDFELWIAGKGDVEDELKKLVQERQLTNKIKFLGRIPLNELHQITSKADLGLSLEENIGLNYYYALPNKLFDYIQAQIPVLVSDLPEMKRIVEDYNVGDVLKERTPEALASKISSILFDEEKLVNWNSKLLIARQELVWEKESKKLLALFNKLN